MIFTFKIKNKEKCTMENGTIKTISFGTDGIRAHANEFPFTQDALYALGKSIGEWTIKKYHATNNPHILIGHDTRISCNQIKNDLIKGLATYPLTIFDGKTIPTPAVCQLIQNDKKFNIGIVISASHNPYQDNGIKLFDALHSKISKDDETTIIALFEKYYKQEDTPQKSQAQIVDWPKAAEIYTQNIINQFPSEFLSGLKIVLDCANGATYAIAPLLFQKLGATVITTGVQPTGININKECGSLYPNHISLLVKQHQADIGFAFDGDGDRLIVVNKHGTIKNGDDLLFLLLSLPEFKDITTVVGTIMSNQGFEEALKKNNKRLIRTKVGDKYVAQEMKKQHLPLGGEISGHVIIKDYLSTSDGIFVALKTLLAIVQTKNWDIETFIPYPQSLINVAIKNKKDLTLPHLADIIKKYESQLTYGRILVRYSATENILRVMVEASSQENVTQTAEKLATELKQAIDN